MMDPRQLGRQYGLTLGDYALGLREVEAAAQQAVDGRLNSIRAELVPLQTSLEKARLVHAKLAERHNLLAERRRSLGKRREGSTAQFSLLKGILYISLSVLLILADLSILGQVIARFLGYPWRTQGGGTFARLVFTDAARAFREFPDLFCLTAAILLIGFFIKVWRDSYLTILSDQPRRIDRAEFWIYSGLLVLAFLAVVAMATARLSLDLGNSQGWATRGVSALLGLALPLVSAGFFLKGYDAIAERLELWRLAVQEAVYSLLTWAWRGRVKRLELLTSGKEEAENEIKSLPLPEREADALRSAYSLGYREGLVDLFSAQGGLSERVRPLIVTRLLTRRQGQR